MFLKIRSFLFIILISVVINQVINAQKIDPKAEIHPTAVLMGNITVGPYTKIGPKVVIQGNVTIGSHVNILGQAVIHVDKITIGNNVRIDYGSRIVSGRQVHPGINANKFPDECYIRDNCWVGMNSTIRGTRMETGSVVGMRAVADFNTHIETGAVLAPGAVAMHDMTIPANTIAEGIPAVITKRSISDQDREKILGVIPAEWIHFENDKIAEKIDKNPPKILPSYPGIDNRHLWKDAIVDPTAQVHPSAILTNTTIGAYTKIGPNVVIARAKIGNHCDIHANSNIRSDVVIGNYCLLGERMHLGSSRDGGFDNPLWMKDYTYISPGSVVHATKIDTGVYYGANVVTDYGVYLHSNDLLMSGSSVIHDMNVRRSAVVRGNIALMDRDPGITDSMWLELAGFIPRLWLKEVNGPALEEKETYAEPLQGWNYTNKGRINPKARIEQGAILVGNVSVDEGARIYPGTYLQGNIHIGKETKVLIGSMIISNDLDVGPHTHIYDQSMIVDGRTDSTGGSPKIDKVRVGAFSWINHMMALQGGIMDDFSLMNIGTGATFGAHLKRASLLLNGSVIYADKIIPERAIVYGVPGEVRITNSTMRERMVFFYGRDFPNWERMASPEDLKKYSLPK